MEAGGEPFQQQLAAIRGDRTHGAAFLAQRAIWALAQVASKESATWESVREAAGKLDQLRPDMASIANGVHLLLARLQKAGEDLRNTPTLATELIAETQGWAEQAAGRAAALIPQTGIVLTCSYSTTVVQTLATAWRQGRRFQAQVLPSAGYGALTAEEAQQAGVDAQVVGTLPRGATSNTTVGLIGADTVYPGSFVVNGAPSLGLAQWCADRGLPFYVVCDSLKIAARAPQDRLVLPRGMQRIPWRYMAAIITESGPQRDR